MVAGSQTSGVQMLFPKNSFNTETKPITRAQLEAYASIALNKIRRKVREKGYDVERLIEADDIQFLTWLATLDTAAWAERILDQGKDANTANRYADQWTKEYKDFEEDSNPFPAAIRTLSSDPQLVYPEQMVRGVVDQQPPGGLFLAIQAMTWLYNEVPAGSVNGTNTVFTLTHTPDPPAALMLLADATILLSPIDYTLLGNQITFAAPPTIGTALLAKQYTSVRMV